MLVLVRRLAVEQAKVSDDGGRCIGDPDQVCAVCLEELLPQDPHVETLECGHRYHSSCMDRIRQSRSTADQCPQCRAPIPKAANATSTIAWERVSLNIAAPWAQANEVAFTTDITVQPRTLPPDLLAVVDGDECPHVIATNRRQVRMLCLLPTCRPLFCLPLRVQSPACLTAPSSRDLLYCFGRAGYLPYRYRRE